jgi:uncharacterized protein (TIGR02996 family)
MDSDAAALWRAILDAPHDDAPRLVYADWLDEHGRPERAEFIRVQCQTANDPEHPARRREITLWSRHAEEWQAELPAPLRAYAFRRGFVYPNLTCDRPIDFLGLGQELFDAAPLWQMNFRPRTGQSLRRLAGAAGLRSLDALDVSGPLPPRGFLAFLNTSPLTNLRLLHVSGFVRDWARDEDVDPARLPQLRRLMLTVSPINVSVMEWLTRSHLVAGLESIWIVGGQLGDERVRTMFQTCQWSNLRELGLPGNQLRAAGIDSILTNQYASNLRVLDLSRNPLGDEGVRALSMWPGLHNVRNLDLAFTEVGPEGAAALIASPFLPNIRVLNLNGTPATRDAGTSTRLRKRFGTGLVGG